MNDVSVFVEGPSDSLAMQGLLQGLLVALREQGTSVHFHPTGGKHALISLIPVKAARMVADNPTALAVAIPDLYPKDAVIAHQTPQQLADGLHRMFLAELQRMHANDVRLHKRFQVFCFKHDLEVLLLAAPEQLGRRINARLTPNWTVPVEEQDFNSPPKRIVEGVFLQHAGRPYIDVTDAPEILRQCNYRNLAAACPQCFKPFVDYLESLLQDQPVP